ncbi:MAG: zinc ABC transporter substrate-binding protein [Pseudomonadota bacterium]
MSHIARTSNLLVRLATGASFGVLAFTGQAAAEANVVATIPAVHSVVSGVMGDTATPHLLVAGGASPHTYSLKPSNAQALSDAQLVVWVGPQIEAFLEGELKTLAPDATVVTLQSLDGTVTHPLREGGLWDAHDHSAHGGHDDHGHDHDDHGDHADHKDHDDHAGHDDHGHEEHAHDDHHDEHKHADHKGHDDHDDHAHHDHDKHDDHANHDDHEGHDDHDHEGHAGIDAHMWLDPRNAIVLSTAVKDELSRIDPDNAATYAQNHAAQVEMLEALDAEISSTLETVSDVRFIVFHDAYQYFETRYGLSSVGSITVSPEVAPGAARVRSIKERIKDRDAKCVFAEPQFKPSILEAVIEGTDAESGVLDPVGADIEPGPQMYSQLLRKLAADLKGCLAS